MLQILGSSENHHLLAAVPAWLNTAWAYVLVVFGFSVVVFVHELGHFLAAKWAGVRIQAFAIGFGHRLFAFRKGMGARIGSTDAEFRQRINDYMLAHEMATKEEIENTNSTELDRARVAAARALGISETEYRFNWLPLGGYVQMLGQEDFVVDKSGELKVKADPDSFTNKPIGKRMVIVSAGVIMNLIFAAILFTIVNMIGIPKPPPVLGYVVENTPASRAGLLPGDRILRINGDEINDFNDLMQRVILSDADETLTMDVERDGKIVSPPPSLRPEYVQEREVRQIGAAPMESLRVMVTVGDPKSARPDELHVADLIREVLVDGKPVTCHDAGLVRREMMRAEGKPIELIVQRPKNPEALTDEQLFADKADIPSDTVKVQIQSVWEPQSYDTGDKYGVSLLGLVPRLTALTVDETKSFAKAGVKAGDVIARIGKYEFPTHAELQNALKEAGSTGVDLEVRRKGVKHDGLSDAAVDFAVHYREDLIRAGIENFAGVHARLAELAKSAKLADADVSALDKTLAGIKSAEEWRRWFERVDVVKLEPLKPAAPFALFTNPLPTIDADVRCIDESQLVVADVQAKFGDRETPAARAGLPRGAVILTVAGQTVGSWSELCRSLEAKAGQDVPIEYRLVDKIEKTSLHVPGSLITALKLGPEDRVISIDGQVNAKSSTPDGRPLSLALPDWRAVEKLLGDANGKSVRVEWVTASGDRKSAAFAATADNSDPWPMRVKYYANTFMCIPKFETNPISNPARACSVGIRQAYRATVGTVQTLRHMLLTKNVGVSNISGPLGIAHKGSQVAAGGVIALFFFLGLISANLAVINFLPLPIVDGGLFLFLILEKVRGEPVSIKTQVATQLLGIALIATVFILVTYQDILRLFS